MFRQMFKEIVEYRELLYAMFLRDVRVKYKQAAMGILWVFFIPALGILSAVIVRYAMAYLQNPDAPNVRAEDIVGVTVKTLPWQMYIAIIGGASMALLGGMGLASKIYFPRQIIPLSHIAATLFDFTIQAIAVVIILFIVPGSPVVVSPALLFAIPLLALVLIQAFGWALIFGSANLFFRDVKYIVQVLLRFGIFFTPVIISVYELPSMFRPIMLLNPVAALLEAFPNCLMNQPIPADLWPWLGYSAAMSIGVAFVGLWTFRRAEPMFAEVM